MSDTTSDLKHDWLQLAAQTQPGIRWTIDRDLKVTSFSGADVTTSNFETNTFLGQSLAAFLSEEMGNTNLLELHKAALAGSPQSGEMVWRNHWYRIDLHPIFANAEQPIGVLASATRAPGRSGAAPINCFDMIEKQALGLIYITGGPLDHSVFHVHYVSDSVHDILGVKASEIYAAPTRILECIHPDDRAEYYALAMKATNNRSNFRIVMRTNPEVAPLRWILCESRPVMISDNEIIFVGIALDVGDLVGAAENAKRELAAAQRQSMDMIQEGWSVRERLTDDLAMTEASREALRDESQALRRLAYQLEEDRSRLAFDLHDTVMPQLAGAQLMLQALTNQFREGSAEIYEQIQQTAQMVENALREGRQLMHELHPIVLKDFGLFRGLDTLIAEYDQLHGFEVDIESSASFRRLDSNTETQLYRIAQAALANAWKHADTNRAKIAISETEKDIVMKIIDEGKGFDTTKISSESFGIRGMRERAIACGGRVTVQSALGEGTVVTATIPQ